MKKLIVFLVTASIALIVYLLFAGTGVDHDASGVRYISSQSYVLNSAECSLCFENTTEKPLRFCVYGVFGGERTTGLDENRRLKSVIIKPNEKRDFVFIFENTPPILPDDVVIVGEYLAK